MDNLFLLGIPDAGEEQANNLSLATVAGVYSDGLSLIPDDQAEATQKHYKYLASAYPAPAAGDRVVVMKMSGTYVVMGSLGGNTSLPAANTVFAGPASGDPAAASFRSLVAADLPVVPISKGGTGQTELITTANVDEILILSEGFSAKWAHYAQFGKIAIVSAAFSVDADVTTSAWTTWATIVPGKRPAFFVTGGLTRTSFCVVQASGQINVSQQVSAGTSYNFSTVYPLP